MIRIGIVDQSQGNGHMFSFSGIINGIDREKIDNCEFETIKEYLPKHVTPDPTFTGRANVTSIWMPNHDYAKRISEFSQIENIFFDVIKLAKNVDAIMVTNDNPTPERQMLISNLLCTGKHVFVDKIPAPTLIEYKNLLKKQVFPGQLKSASGMRYFPEFLDLNFSEEISSIRIDVPKSWALYAIHGVELMVSLLQKNSLDFTAGNFEELDGVSTRNFIFTESGNFVSVNASNQESTKMGVEVTFKSSEILSLTMGCPFSAFTGMLDDWLSNLGTLRDLNDTLWFEKIFYALGDIH
jgi:hypothetical protein